MDEKSRRAYRAMAAALGDALAAGEIRGVERRGVERRDIDMNVYRSYRSMYARMCADGKCIEYSDPDALARSDADERRSQPATARQPVVAVRLSNVQAATRTANTAADALRDVLRSAVREAATATCGCASSRGQAQRSVADDDEHPKFASYDEAERYLLRHGWTQHSRNP